MSEPKPIEASETELPGQAVAEAPPERINELEAEIAKFKDQWLRAVAEAENIRKRAERDLQEAGKYAISAFARDMVSVLENLSRAAETISPEKRAGDEQLKLLAEGIDLTQQELLQIFERYHIRRLFPLNEPFDHQFHQAVVQIERDDVPAGTVIQVVQAGYTIGERLLKPAMVAVSKQGESAKKVDTTV